MKSGGGVSPQWVSVSPDAVAVKGEVYRVELNAPCNLTLARNSFTANTTNFTYGPDGERVKKVNGPSSTTYIGSGYEISANTSNLTAKSYVFMGDFRIAERRSDGKIFFLHTDHLNSTNVVTDAAGLQVQLYEYEPYGMTVRDETDSSQLEAKTSYKFTGQEEDASTGLYYYHARYYDPELGRFVQADSIVQSPYDPQTLNRYAYCRNNPVKFVDPDGNSFFKQWLGTIISVALTFVGMPFIGAIVGAAVNTLMNGGSFKDFAIGVGVGLAAGYVGGTIAGAIGKELGMKMSSLGVGLMRGAMSGAVSGAGMAAIYGGNIGKGALQGAAYGAGTAGVMWGTNMLRTAHFINKHIKFQSNYTAEQKAAIIQGLKDAGQSPVGQRLFTRLMLSDKIIKINLIHEPNGYSTVGGSEVWLNPDISVIQNVQAPSYNQFGTIDMATYIVHELGHSVGYSDGTPQTASLNTSYSENPYRAWVGSPARTGYHHDNQVPFKRWVFQY